VWTTTWQTNRITDSGSDVIGPKCVVEGTLVNISTTQTVPVESLYPSADVLTMDCIFNTDDHTVLETLTSETIISSKPIHHVSNLYRFSCIGVYIINDGLLKTTEDHFHVIKRDGLWQVKRAMDLQVGDKFLNIQDEEVEITSLVLDSANEYTVWRVDVEPNDVYYANGILTHNIKIEP
jgi:hypothetical protein